MKITGVVAHLVLLRIIEQALGGKTNRWITIAHLFEVISQHESALPAAERCFFGRGIPRTLDEAGGLTGLVRFLALLQYLEARPDAVRLTEEGRKIVAEKPLAERWRPVVASLRRKMGLGSQA